MESVSELPPILVVDDDPGLLLSIKATLLSADLPEPDTISDSRLVMDRVRNNAYKIILLDLLMPHINGMELLEMIKKEFPETVCLIVTATDEVSTAIQAIRLGAYDYLVKPVDGEKLVMIIQRALKRYHVRKEVARFADRQSFSDLANPQAFNDIVAEDKLMALVFCQVEAVAPTDYSVVITGESGTGKEMMARMIHQLSCRASGPFIAVNMAAFTQTLFEDEFFGHTKGAYTHAVSDKKGFFEAAHGGTLFLDEITELAPSLQGKLLRVIQEKEFYRLGSTSSKSIDVRILAATNRDILDEVKTERFRADLFYRLSMYTIKIPPLRERKKDILPLARHFVQKYGNNRAAPITSLSPELEQCLLEYAFPGNIRELENMMASAVLLEKSQVLTLSSVRSLHAGPHVLPGTCSELMTLEDMEKEHILRVLKETGGNRKKAAVILGINTATVYRKIEKYRISDNRFRDDEMPEDG
jgi:DNA-binding NtrC family response regulator